MAQKQPEQPSQIDRSRESFRRESDQRDPNVTPPVAYDEAIAGHEPDGGESLLSGAPREGEAAAVDKVSTDERFPQIEESGTPDHAPPQAMQPKQQSSQSEPSRSQSQSQSQS